MSTRERLFDIKCGDLNGRFMGRSGRDAFIRAVKGLHPEALATLFRFREARVSRAVWFYQDAERALKRAGLFGSSPTNRK